MGWVTGVASGIKSAFSSSFNVKLGKMVHRNYAPREAKDMIDLPAVNDRRDTRFRVTEGMKGVGRDAA
jgi:hypothetical protein